MGLRERLTRLDRQMLGECERVFSNACNTANRLARYNGVQAEPLYHPPRLAPRLVPGPYGDYLLSVGRIESVKRADLAVRALPAIDRPIRLMIAGDGTQRANVERLADSLGVRDRVDFLGSVDDDRLVDLYAHALAVVYAPFDEDFGYVTLEAFLARKPVITCHDSGGVLEFVQHDVNGFVLPPDAAAIADAATRLHHHRAQAPAFGDAGHARAAAITWDGVIDRLVGAL